MSEGAARLLEISLGLLRSRILHAAAELGIADHLAAGPRSCAQLALITGTDADSLYRVLRALTAMGVFTEQPDRQFALNDTAELLRSDSRGSARDLVRYLGADWNVRTLGNLIHSLRTGAPAFDEVNGSSLFVWLEQHPEDARCFDAALGRFAGRAIKAVVAGFDFSSFRRVVDVGGGKGRLLRALLEAHPSLNGVLFDRPDVIESAQRELMTLDVVRRLELVPGDFFEAVPREADAYLLKNVIHDWDDERSVRVLSNCARAMRADSKVLLVESLIDDTAESELTRLMDVGMLTTTGGRERTAEEYAELFRRANLRLLRVVRTGSALCVIEAGL